MGATILIIDDTQSLRYELQTVLQSAELGETFLQAKDGASGFQLLVANPVDLIFCDVWMPSLDGFKFLKLKQDRSDFDEIPVIMLTGQDQVEVKVKSLECGASDYLTKPFHPAELVARTRVHLNIKQLRDQLRSKNEQLERLSRSDALTGLSNRRHIFEALEREFARSNRYQHPLSCLMIDVDHFKRINDEHGHLVGDEVLIEFARVLEREVRQCDHVGRYGGEEFLVVMPETDLEAARTVAERCRVAIADREISVKDGTIQITASLGVASYPHPDVQSIQELLARADQALYSAKSGGRNRIEAA